MPHLSQECLDHLRAIDGQLNYMIDMPNVRRRGAVFELREFVEVFLRKTIREPDHECIEILRDLEPRIGFIIRAITNEEPSALIDTHLRTASEYIRRFGNWH